MKLQKKHRDFLIVLLVIFILSISLPLIYNNHKITNEIYEIVLEELDTPWAIDFLPGGDMVFTERKGVINRFDKSKKELIKIPVTEVSESGLLGIAVDPEFNRNNFIYVYYSYTQNNLIKNKVSRFSLINNKLVNETVLIDNIPGAQYHNGGRIKFGPDNKLYITTGDATDPGLAQNLNSLAGKILRMNKDGSIPEENLFQNYVYSYGHRNPQGIDWNLKGDLFGSEHGPSRNDEINIIRIGGNYDWPARCEDKINLNTIRCFSEFTLAPGSLTIYENNIYVTGLRGNQLRKLQLDEEYNILDEKIILEGIGRLREVVTQGNYLYVSTSNRDGRGVVRPGDDKIIRIKLN